MHNLPPLIQAKFATAVCYTRRLIGDGGRGRIRAVVGQGRVTGGATLFGRKFSGFRRPRPVGREVAAELGGAPARYESNLRQQRLCTE